MNTKFKSIVTGAILEPNSEMVAEQLRKNPSFVAYDGQETAQGEGKPLSKMNKDELLKVTQDAEIAVPDGATKAEIVELIKAAQGDEYSGTAERWWNYVRTDSFVPGRPD